MRVYEFMAAEKANFPITFMCDYLGVSPSGYDDWAAGRAPAAREREDQRPAPVPAGRPAHRRVCRH